MDISCVGTLKWDYGNRENISPNWNNVSRLGYEQIYKKIKNVDIASAFL
jgi:hypothetical protein